MNILERIQRNTDRMVQDIRLECDPYDLPALYGKDEYFAKEVVSGWRYHDADEIAEDLDIDMLVAEWLFHNYVENSKDLSWQA